MDWSDRRRLRARSQVGFILRQASQRHTALFASAWAPRPRRRSRAALAKLHEIGPTSQNQLGRMTAMDVATIKGVVDRLMKRGLSTPRPTRRTRAAGCLCCRRTAGLSSKRMSRRPTPSRGNPRAARRAREGAVRRPLGQAEVEARVRSATSRRTGRSCCYGERR